MNKQNKQKGFTLVELVIVIAVIAILAGVLIPEFSGIVEKANKSAALQNCKNTYQEATLAIVNTDVDLEGKYLGSNGYYFKIEKGTLEAAKKDDVESLKSAELSNGVKLYGETGVEIVTNSRFNNIPEEIYEPLITFTATSKYSLTVYDEDGNVFYKESAIKEIENGCYFCMFNNNINDGNNSSWDSSGTPSEKLKSLTKATDAEGWYSYVLTIDSNSTPNYGVFYYSAK